MRRLACTLPLIIGATAAIAQIDAGLFRFPDVSKDQIVFTYANDLWVMPKDGGSAVKLSSPSGVESYPKFSPDGKNIAFTGNYDGNSDVYVIPAAGGVPVRLTSHGYPDRVVDWTTDGKSFSSPVQGKAARPGSTSSLRFPLPAGLRKNFRWPMENSHLILPMENKWLLFFAPR